MQLFELKELIQFVDDFERQSIAIRKEHVSTELEGYQELFEDYDTLELTLKQILKEQSPYFNIFSILNIRHYETKVHTPFLCNLFNPMGSHGQGSLFLEVFLKNIIHSCKEEDIIDNVIVYEELSMRFGRLDIMIDYRVNGIKKVLVIENKIYHHDGEQQLKRYYDFLKEDRKLEDQDFQMVYLTIHKSLPSIQSMSLELFNELRYNNIILCVGYKVDIVHWLFGCLPKVSSVSVKVLLRQYIETIQTL